MRSGAQAHEDCDLARTQFSNTEGYLETTLFIFKSQVHMHTFQTVLKIADMVPEDGFWK